MPANFSFRIIPGWLFNKFFNQSWAVAIKTDDFGIIADWFSTYFAAIGLVALVLVGIAAGLSDVDGVGPETRLRDVAAFSASHPGFQGAPQVDRTSSSPSIARTEAR
jgi:hypothetical protein